MAYIIGIYNKYDQWDRSHAVQKFEINEQMYAIYEVELVWGLPALKYQVDQEDVPEMYRLYETLEEAQEFVRCIKHFNR